MRYLGGKTRLAKHISEAILNDTPFRGRFHDPFVGGGSIMNAMVPHFNETFISDIHPDLIHLYQKIASEGTEWLPESITEEEWRTYRSSDISALRGFVGFGCSFGGRWFEGYARSGTTNYAAQSKRSLIKHEDTWKKVTDISCKSYLDIHPQENDVVYLDPPYANTKPYSGTDKFNAEEFWDKAKSWAEESGAHIYVSEYNAPEGWESIWSKEKKITMDSLYTKKSQIDREVKKDMEHLFVYRG